MTKEVNPMRSSKKQYETPQLVRRGDVDEITRLGGAEFIDVPMGTPIGPPDSISS